MAKKEGFEIRTGEIAPLLRDGEVWSFCAAHHLLLLAAAVALALVLYLALGARALVAHLLYIAHRRQKPNSMRIRMSEAEKLGLSRLS